MRARRQHGEALLYKLLETVEGDGFLMTWYERLPVPRIDPGAARDRTIPLQAAAITAETGYRVELYDTTVEHGIPSVWATGVGQDGDPGRPRMVCAAPPGPVWLRRRPCSAR
ncbi:YcaO-like family protein [Nonomuraea angiospora]|uniref:Ribosomal protein S12 methylthiotransferase accessory factor YcaO n=1 Tax=Nonomuraea angiospora TaxID=46172 RepID=A0ABR9MC46_9ACTN|nr:YcaO-like family protein [Nonomuraea angiospora]MBE1589931.1 ribosomal protein S12 methylthiotransferase accessory factor YcaO [Nonomuraea angiospora]